MKHRAHWLFPLVITMVPTVASCGIPLASPSAVGMDAEHLGRIDQVVEQALAEERMPGCVVCVGRHGRIVWRKAYGFRQLVPEKLPMAVDTLFDMASITKPVATATSVMMLVERGVLRLRDRVSDHIPEFGQNGKAGITILDLLVHQGGLIADNAVQDYADGHDEAFRRINLLSPQAEPGTSFIYSDVGFLVLAELVEKKTGMPIDEFARRNLFEPLGMDETGYRPSGPRQERAAATGQRNNQWIRGEVHDPRSYLLGGVAGHAGLFSTADDLALYARMMLNGGQLDGTRILSEATIRTMTASHSVSQALRGLGWDKQSNYSTNRGELFSSDAFGHSGFTGTSLWIDPRLDLFVIFLSNQIHPHGKRLAYPVAGRIGTVAAAAIDRAASDTQSERFASSDNVVLPGIDVLRRQNFARLEGRRVGLITNHTGIARDGKRTVEILHEAPNVQLVALFSPEHGFVGQLDQAIVGNSKDQTTGIEVFSLYGEHRRPTAEMVRGVDTLVFDIQDIGARFYTYVSTMGEAMKAAAEFNLRFVVLDRPNPINGTDVEGPVLDKGLESFVGFHEIPVRHGMTVGELARMINAELELKLDLDIVPVENWRRTDYFDATGLLWVNPSPNMRNLNEAILYPAIGLVETTNLSVGRGTDTPFEVLGAPWLDAQRFAAALNGAQLPGVRFVPIRFTPESSKFAGEQCGGVYITITDRSRFRPLRVSWAIVHHLATDYRNQWNAPAVQRLLIDRQVSELIQNGATPELIEAAYAAELSEFLVRRARYLLY